MSKPILLIGDYPDAQESIPGYPTLNRLLKTIGVSSSACKIINVFNHVPKKPYSLKKPKDPENYSENYSRPWLSHELIQATSELAKKLNKSEANVVVPLGDVALLATTSYYGISKYRGSVLTDPRNLHRKKIIPTIHPRNLVHDFKNPENYLRRYYVSMDLLKIKRESEFPEIITEEKDLIINPTYGQAIEYLEKCKSYPRLGFDIETMITEKTDKFTDSEISTFSISYDRLSSICIPFLTKENNHYFILPQEVEIWKRLIYLLESPKYEIIIQNGMFDAFFLAKKLKIHITNIKDTMAGMGIISPEFPKDLGFLCSLYTDQPYYKDDRKRSAGVISDQFQLYSARDSLVLHDILDAELREIERQNNLETFNRTCALMPVLVKMQERGMLVNQEGLKVESLKLEQEIEETRAELNKLAGRELNANSPKQLQEYFYVEKKYPAVTKQGKITTDVDAMKKLAAKGIKEASIVLKIRGMRKEKSTYMDMALDSDSRLRCSYNTVPADKKTAKGITETGRLASSATIFGTGGNSQNLSKRFKKNIHPDPGYMLYEIDYSQAENRIVAHIAPEPMMIDAFNTGKDVHSLTGALISGLPYEQVIEDNKNGVFAKEIGTGEKTWRYWGKQSNHALNYKRGPVAFSMSFGCTVAQAKALIASYFRAYPGISHYHSWVEREINDKKYLINCMGRKRVFRGLVNDALYRKAYNQIPQSTVGDLINERGLIFIDQDPYLQHIELLNQVHDSIIFQIPLELGWNYHANALTKIQYELEKPITWKVTEFSIPAEIKMGLSLGDMHEVDILHTRCANDNAPLLEQVYERIKS
jgi:DNA polymerase I-like protein with 3'-5' exonuclease and polymerase domains